MSSKTSSKAVLTAATLAGSLMLAGSSFAMTDLASGYMLSPGGGGEKAGEGKCGMDKMDADKDGQISKAEFAAAHDGSDEKFASYDSSGDGFIDAAEMDARHAGKEGKAMGEGKCGEGKCGGSA